MYIRVFQINHDRDKNRVKFCGIAETGRHQGAARIDSSIYDEVFAGNVDCKDLEEIYTLFNSADTPLTHRGHSLSVSDVLATQYGYYFVDSIGFEPIEFDEALTQKSDNLRRAVVAEFQSPEFSDPDEDMDSGISMT